VVSEFSKLERKLAHKKGVKNPRALAAKIGDEAIGKHEMADRSAQSREKHKRERRRH
jgi:hypothetical protein